MIERSPRELALLDEIRELETELAKCKAENDQLRGCTPALPPRFGSEQTLPRYGIKWHGPQTPLTVPMEDGYWTPYHLAAQREDNLLN